MAEKIDVTIEDLYGQQREIADIIGFEAYLKLSEHYGGMRPIYISKLSDLQRTRRNREILRKFDGYNFTALAREYDLTEQTIREIVRPVMQSVRNKPLDDQTTLFD